MSSSARSWSAAKRRSAKIVIAGPPRSGVTRQSIVLRESLQMDARVKPGHDAAAPVAVMPEQEDELRSVSYWPFVLPALIVVLAVIVFPWVFTIWMSLHEWKVGSPTTFVGLSNYLRMPNDPRFVEAVWHTLVYTALSVILPLVFGTLAAVVFHQKFPLRGVLR